MHLDYATIRNTVLWVLVAIAVLGVLLAVIIKKIIGKILTLVLAAVLIFIGWQQRARVVDYATSVKADACASHPHFLGIDVSFPTC